MSDKVIVIGGGIGGMTAAIRLALHGFDVTLFEQLPRLGGKAGFVRHNEYYFDTGPSLVTMPHVLHAVFADAGKDINDYLTLVPIDPVCRYFWNDGTSIDTYADDVKMQAALATISEEDARRYPHFMQYSGNIYSLTSKLFLESPIHETAQLLKAENLHTLLRLPQIDPFRNMNQSVRRFFSDEKTIQLFNRYATYNGSNPYAAPATLNIIPYVEYRIGGFYIKGGIYTLVQALERLMRELGVRIELGAPVSRILHDGSRVTGVECAGETHRADAVVCNADVADAHRRMLPDFPQRTRELEALEPSLSGMVFLWGMNRKFDSLAHHNVLFSDSYELEFKELFEQKTAPSDPTVYISIPSKTDDLLDSHNGESWFVLVNMPYLAGGQDWDALTARTRETIIRKLAMHGIAIRDSIGFEQIIRPEDFARMYGANKGSIYGLSSNTMNSAFKRPANRSRELKGLYFAGGSAHPGGGIPLVMLSAKIAADLVAQKFQNAHSYSGH